MDNSSILENIILNKKMLLMARRNLVPSNSALYGSGNGDGQLRKRGVGVCSSGRRSSTQCFGMSSNFTFNNIKTTSIASRFQKKNKTFLGEGNVNNIRDEHVTSEVNYYNTRERRGSAPNNNEQERSTGTCPKVKVSRLDSRNEPINELKNIGIFQRPNIINRFISNIQNKIKNEHVINTFDETVAQNQKTFNNQDCVNDGRFNRFSREEYRWSEKNTDGLNAKTQGSSNCIEKVNGNCEIFIRQEEDSKKWKEKTAKTKETDSTLFLKNIEIKNQEVFAINMGKNSGISPFRIVKSNSKEQIGKSIIFDDTLFENEINKNQLKNFEKIYYYKDIKFYFNLYQEYRKSGVLEVQSYWMGILEGPIYSAYDDFDISKLLENDIFIHNLKFCLILFVYNSNIEEIVRRKVHFPLLIYNLKKFSYFTNDTDLLFDWNEKFELFSIGYEFDIFHYIEYVPKYFVKNWILFENDFPLRLSDLCVQRYGENWIELLLERFNVDVKFLKSDSAEDKRVAYETLFKLYKQCIFYVSYCPENEKKSKSNWYYECFLNGTPILTTDENEFGFYDYYDNSYNLVFIDEITWNFTNLSTCTYIDYIRNLFNTKNIHKMSSLIYKMRTNLIDYKVNVVDYFKFVHFTIFKLNKVKNNNNVLNELVVL